MSLEDIREKKTSIWIYLVIGLLLIGMAGFGTSQFGMGGGNVSPTALKTANAEITQAEFQRVLSNNRQNYQDMSPAEVENTTLLQLQQRLALTEYLQNHPLAASNTAIDKVIRDNPAFHDNGQFSEAVFRRTIPVEPQAYRNSVSKDLAMQNFQQSIAATGVVSQAEIAPFNEMQNLSRDILVAKLARSAFANTADAAEIQAYYEANKDQYVTAEQFAIDYIDLNPQNIADSIQVSDAEIIAAGAAPRRANYYLFADQASAQAAVAAVQAGKSAATVASEMADKVDDNGDLGSLKPKEDADSLIPQNAIDAIFALDTVGQVTAPITVDGGFYVFELTDKPGENLSEAAKTAAKKALQAEKAAPQVAELNEKLNKAVFESGNSDLNDIAEVVDLPLKTVELQAAGQGGDSVLALPEMAQALQNSDKTTGKLQEPVTIGERVIIYRINTVKAPQQKPLSEVKTAVEQAVIAEKTDKQIAAAAKALIAKTQTEGLQAAADAGNYPTQAFANFTGQVTENPVLDAIGALLIAQQTPVVGEKNAQELKSVTGDTYVYVNTAIRLGSADSDNVAGEEKLQQSLAASLGQMEFSDFVESITSRTEIKVRSGLLQSDTP